MLELTDWIDECSGKGFVWLLKRLSGNDTLANGSHQAGPYIPRDLLLELIPDLNRPNEKNPEFWFDMYTASHGEYCRVRAVWYNNKLRGGTRNETRVTNLGGSGATLLNPESTGSLCIFAFEMGKEACHAWVCRDSGEEDAIQDRIGPVEPGKWLTWRPAASGLSMEKEKRHRKEVLAQIPNAWLKEFPSTTDLLRKSIELAPFKNADVDQRLLRRREHEFELFRAVEEAVELPIIRKQLTEIGSIDAFIAIAQRILQRRKSRAGRSLELHARQIFLEEGLQESLDFAYQAETEPGRRPDFLFPSVNAYKALDYPVGSLRMLAVKTTCRDRWRQILNEADRIKHKHLLTLQEGVSEAQFREMEQAGVRLVVPSPLVSSFPRSIRPNIIPLAKFIEEIHAIEKPTTLE